MSTYYVKRGKQRYGPFSATRLRQLAAAGKLQSDDLIGDTEGKEVPARKIRGLLQASSNNIPLPATSGTPTHSNQDDQPPIIEVVTRRQDANSPRSVRMHGWPLPLIGFVVLVVPVCVVPVVVVRLLLDGVDQPAWIALPVLVCLLLLTAYLGYRSTYAQWEITRSEEGAVITITYRSVGLMALRPRTLLLDEYASAVVTDAIGLADWLSHNLLSLFFITATGGCAVPISFMLGLNLVPQSSPWGGRVEFQSAATNVSPRSISLGTQADVQQLTRFLEANTDLEVRRESRKKRRRA